MLSPAQKAACRRERRETWRFLEVSSRPEELRRAGEGEREQLAWFFSGGSRIAEIDSACVKSRRSCARLASGAYSAGSLTGKTNGDP
jgi:hypothetical protein